MEIKYTNDGKKVAVLGRLNSAEFIVQEIFVSGGQEIPSGENFVVSSLHDAPAESWKEKNLRNLNERYEEEKKALDVAIGNARRQIKEVEAKARARASAIFAFAKNAEDSQLGVLHDFLAGEITHFFVSGYRPRIVGWDDDSLYDADRTYGFRADGIRLVSLFGSSDGRLDYRINKYRDGSGDWEPVTPCRSYDDALDAAQRELDCIADLYVSGEGRSFYPDSWVKIDGIKIPESALEKLKAEKRKNTKNRIKKLQDEIASLEGSLKG